MTPTTLTQLHGRAFDAVIVGGGISGASAAQHLAAAGYSVLLVEKNDYASAATSRSGRLLHCGLRYLGPAYSPWEFLRDPRKLTKAVSAAWRSIRSSSEFVRTSPGRQRPMNVYAVIERGMAYRGWQVDIGARLLQWGNLNRQSLGYRRFRAGRSAELPYVGWLRDTGRMTDVIRIRDRQFWWPERICIDAVMDAQRLGAVVRNYTEASGLERSAAGGWQVRLADTLSPNDTAEVSGKALLNMAGPWIDRLNRMTGQDGVPRKIVAVKGVHILVRLPDRLRGEGFMGFNRMNEGLTCLPWGEMHFVGPTETLYDGDLDDVRPEEADVREILEEVNHLLPGIGLTRGDVRQAWAGVRPITYHPDFPKGDRMSFSKLHDMTDEGLPNVFTLTWAAIMFHRSAAREIVAAVGRRVAPSGAPRAPSFAPPPRPRGAAPPVIEGSDAATLDDVVHAVTQEQARGLVDILFRRLPVGWFMSVPPDAVECAARAAAGPAAWSEAQTRQEIRAFRDYVARYHLDDGLTPWAAA